MEGQILGYDHSPRKLGLVSGSVSAETAVERMRRGLGEKGLLPRSPQPSQPSHAHACPPAVNNTLLTTGSHLIPTASLPPPSLGKTSPEVPSLSQPFGKGKEERTLTPWDANGQQDIPVPVGKTGMEAQPLLRASLRARPEVTTSAGDQGVFRAAHP